MNRIAVVLGTAVLAGSLVGFFLFSDAEPEGLDAHATHASAPKTAPAPALASFDDPSNISSAVAEANSAAAPALDVAAAPNASAALGKAPEATPLAEGVVELGQYLTAPELRPAEAIALGRAVAGDPEVAGPLAEQAAAWRGSGDPALRARGLLVEASLGLVDATGWLGAVDAEPNAEARALMAASAPTGASDDEDARLTRGLLELAQRDLDAEVRSAALIALPRLGAREATDVLSILSSDASSQVREDAARHLSGAPADANLASGLLASATRVDEEPAVRRAAVMALIRMEERAPGTLSSAGGTREQVAAVLEATSGDRS